MDNNKACKQTKEYATLLFLDVPVGTTIGCDNMSWSSGPLFKGIKMIPPGVHMFHCTASNELGDPTTISSSFIYIDNTTSGVGLGEDDEEQQQQWGRVIIKKWDPETEEFYPDHVISEQERESYTLAVRSFEFDKNLAPYPYDGTQLKWTMMTQHISKTLLDRILPISGIINGDACAFDNEDPANSKTSRKEKKMLDELDEKLKDFNQKRQSSSSLSATTTTTTTTSINKKETEEREGWGVPYFSKIPKQPKKARGTLTPAEISRWNVDKSDCLKYVLDRYYPGAEREQDILGEIEFCFVLFIYGMAWSAFQQWKELVCLFLQCDTIVSEKPALFCSFFKILKTQLSEAPSDMFESDLSNKFFIKPLLKSFIESVYSEGTENVDQALFKSVLELKSFTLEKFGWDLNLFTLNVPIDSDTLDDINETSRSYYYADNSDDDDDKPVIVDTQDMQYF
ncbi:hypothetical protein CYY_007807 [Polysphondylium violaceum]|uniref:Uncharacterized protein n=1 Tax=Polysphondylium violaceum TaxID=133409 RepID=A0A8J4PWN5_9MYCE|nr:hypothetical protein CYY_007807 [Polysphondylium violaceum]